MKKLLYTMLGLCALAVSSCSMDEVPYDVIMEDDALITTDDCRSYRNSFYSNLRALSTGAYISYTEIQMDMFVGTVLNGNNIGNIANGIIQSSDGDIESIWGGLFGGIGDVNFYFLHMPAVMESVEQKIADLENSPAEGKEEQLAQLNLQLERIKRYNAEAHFTRAFFYYWLMDHYCQAYTEQNKDVPYLGLPLVDTYAPTAVKDNYPGRATLAETYKFIEDDLQTALDGLLAWEAYWSETGRDLLPADDPDNANLLTNQSPYISSDAVKAMQARMALLKRDWNGAYNKAKEVIDTRRYTLVSRRNYPNMWTKDNGTEIIFRPYSASAELGISQTGAAWISTSKFVANYIPVANLAAAGPGNVYESDADVRYTTFVGKRDLVVEGARIAAPIFNKYPGNTSLQSSSGIAAIYNIPKPFRASELYLICAEALQEMGDSRANDYINELRSQRITNYTAQNYSGDQLRDEVRKERLRELIGEGFRMSDLRRWGLGFTRDASHYAAYPNVTTALTTAGPNVSYEPGDHRYVWPIPTSELQVNPNMAGQQNPGYE